MIYLAVSFLIGAWCLTSAAYLEQTGRYVLAEIVGTAGVIAVAWPALEVLIVIFPL